LIEGTRRLNSPGPDHGLYDVVILGGALAGASAAILLLRERPGLRVLLVEKSAAFTRRVGEATIEVSAYFLGRILGLTQYLNESHLVKQGMRFWFSNQQARTLEDSSEIGGSYLARVPAYQVDRSTLDEEVLRRACALGAELWRPASAQKAELVAGGEQTVSIRRGEQTATVRARWVLDASGVAALLSRQNGWFRPNHEHPTTAVWSRWTGVKDWDSPELAKKFPAWAAACHGIRFTATNHFVGSGWWAWCIPLKGGDVSIGVVFDERLVDWPSGGSLGQRLKDFLGQHPVAREIMAEAQWQEGDVHWRRQLPYSSALYAGDGFALLGDAGAFLDPLYSPGMDWVSFTVTRATDLVLGQQRGEAMAPLVSKHNRDFVRSYDWWFRAVYLNKYEYLGDYELMRLAFLLDLGFYYLGVASQPFKMGLDGLRNSLFATPPSVPCYHLMRTYNRRFAAIARARRERGVWGRCNAGHRFLFGGYTFAPSSMKHILKALAGWGWLELTEGWRTWFTTTPVVCAEPMKKPTPATASS
jgi:flavin-dependent dehydrogenase